MNGNLRASAVILGLLASACGSDGIAIDSVSSVGSVGGVIVDGATRTGVAGVAVSLVAGGTVFEPVVTAADGSFAFEKVPAGGVIVVIEPESGYESAWVRGELPAAAGEYPTDNSTLTLGPIGLVPTSGSFALRVLDVSGQPVSGYQLGVQSFVQYVDLGDGSPDAHGEVLRTATTDADGYVTFTGMPDFFGLGPSVPDGVVVFLPPRDANADGIYEFGGSDRIFNLRDLDDPTPDVVLTAGFESSLAVRASTISALVAGGGVPAVLQRSGSIHVKFNLPIQADARVTLTDEYGDAVAGTPGIEIRDDSLALSLAPAQLEAGAEYNLTIHAVAAVGDRLVEGDFGGAFFTPAEATVVSVVDATRDADQQVTVTFSEPVGGLGTSLAGSNCVLFFQVDLDGAGGIGNAANELGNASCNVALSSDEPNPAGPAGTSGYTTRWSFTAPTIDGATGPVAIPQNTPVHVVFSRVSSASAIVQRPSGAPAGDLMFLMPQAM